MKLTYDPADGVQFWDAISRIPGYPRDVQMPIKYMLFESGALFRTSEVLKAVGAKLSAPLIIIWDTTLMHRSGEDLKQLIANTLRGEGWDVRIVVMQPDESGQVHTDMAHIEFVKENLLPGCALLAVGSGVVTDIAKHSCFLFQQESGACIPYVVFQTANSVSAFTSNMAPIFVDGIKRTLDSRYPDALICDLETLRDAPHWMTVAGVGDMLAPYVSLTDWYLAYRLGMDPTYSELPEKLLGPIGEIYLAEATGIRSGDLRSVALLAKTIALGGLSMSLSHATTPLSGFEHVFSHVLDLQNEMKNIPLATHGTQVALTTIIGVNVYHTFLNEFEPAELNPQQCYPTMEKMEQVVKSHFATIDPSGKAGAECWADYHKKLEIWHTHRAEFEAFLRDWPTLRTQLEGKICSATQLVKILEAVGSPVSWEEITPRFSEEQVKFAFLNAPLMRKRLTIGDLLIFFNWDRENLWKQLWQRRQS